MQNQKNKNEIYIDLPVEKSIKEKCQNVFDKITKQKGFSYFTFALFSVIIDKHMKDDKLLYMSEKDIEDFAKKEFKVPKKIDIDKIDKKNTKLTVGLFYKICKICNLDFTDERRNHINNINKSKNNHKTYNEWNFVKFAKYKKVLNKLHENYKKEDFEYVNYKLFYEVINKHMKDNKLTDMSEKDIENFAMKEFKVPDNINIDNIDKKNTKLTVGLFYKICKICDLDFAEERKNHLTLIMNYKKNNQTYNEWDFVRLAKCKKVLNKINKEKDSERVTRQLFHATINKYMEDRGLTDMSEKDIENFAMKEFKIPKRVNIYKNFNNNSIKNKINKSSNSIDYNEENEEDINEIRFNNQTNNNSIKNKINKSSNSIDYNEEMEEDIIHNKENYNNFNGMQYNILFPIQKDIETADAVKNIFNPNKYQTENHDYGNDINNLNGNLDSSFKFNEEEEENIISYDEHDKKNNSLDIYNSEEENDDINFTKKKRTRSSNGRYNNYPVSESLEEDLYYQYYDNIKNNSNTKDKDEKNTFLDLNKQNNGKDFIK